MQPCYLPWLGHLRLMALADRFVFLDDAQYSKNSWQNRNRIILGDGRVAWLTVPIVHDGINTPLNRVRIDVDPRWRRKHVQTLRQSYGRHPHFADLGEILKQIEKGTQEYLADLNCDLLQIAAARCKVRAILERSSALRVEGKRAERLERFCSVLGCASYLSTPGARTYLEADLFGAKTGLKLEYMDVEFAPYIQKNSPSFVPQMSFVDALANIGWMGVSGLINSLSGG